MILDWRLVIGYSLLASLAILPRRHWFVVVCSTLFLWPLMVKVRCTRQSPPMRGRSLTPLVVEVCCMWQSPPTRDNSWWPSMVKVCCDDKVLQWGADFLRPMMVEIRWMWQSPPTRGNSWRHIAIKVRCMWQSPPTRGMILEVITPNDEWYHMDHSCHIAQ